MISLTKDKFRLALQNLIKGCKVQGQLISCAGGVCAMFILYSNCAFCLYKMDKVADAVTFCNQALVLGEEVLASIGDHETSIDTWTILRELTFALFFVRGNEPKELKKAFKEFVYLDEADPVYLTISGRKVLWRMLSETYLLLAEALGSVNK